MSDARTDTSSLRESGGPETGSTRETGLPKGTRRAATEEKEEVWGRIYGGGGSPGGTGGTDFVNRERHKTESESKEMTGSSVKH